MVLPPILLGASLLHYLFGIALFLVALFLILLILVQRGRGGGLTGALGGMGGQSAFGTKAGDTFTRVTMGAAAIWILLSMGAILVLNSQNPWGSASGGPPRGAADSGSMQSPASPDTGSPDTGSPDAGRADAGAGDNAASGGPAQAAPGDAAPPAAGDSSN